MRKYTKVKCCDCGKEWEKRNDSIKMWDGRCKSCASKELIQRPGMIEIVRKNGLDFIKKFGQIPNSHRFKKGEMSGSNNPTWKGGFPKCKDCGKELSKRNAKLCHPCYGKSRVGVKRSKEVIEKLRLNALKGDKSPGWKGGKCAEIKKLRSSSAYKDWRTAVFIRDNYTCQDCGARSGVGKQVTLNADHIKSFAEYPELRFDISNGKTLCLDCHRKTPTFGWKLSNKKMSKNYFIHSCFLNISP